MITFTGVNKRFPDGTQAVTDLTLTIPDGEIVVLVGPSGCGKTTTLRLINRMEERTSGAITLDGRDVTALPKHELRRSIGYVIQAGGLFPHRTVLQNIATVPRLLGWDKARALARARELLDVVGLDGEVARRFPHQLSGGQQQRVGVARALAVDPPVLLMDEPFGAVDPVVRQRLQQELLRLQQTVKKTIVFVTHDIDEAITMGDRIALFSAGGVLEQYASPAELLAQPKNAFVADFLGEERGLKRLSLRQVYDVTASAGPVVAMDASAADAAKVAAENGTDWVVVLRPDRTLYGWATVAELGDVSRLSELDLPLPRLTVQATDSLRAALNAMVVSQVGVAVRLSETGTYEGIVTHEILSGELLR